MKMQKQQDTEALMLKMMSGQQALEKRTRRAEEGARESAGRTKEG